MVLFRLIFIFFADLLPNNTKIFKEVSGLKETLKTEYNILIKDVLHEFLFVDPKERFPLLIQRVIALAVVNRSGSKRAIKAHMRRFSSTLISGQSLHQFVPFFFRSSTSSASKFHVHQVATHLGHF